MKLLPLFIAALATVCLGSATVLAQDTTCHSLVIQVVQTFPEIPTIDDTGLVRAKIFARPSGTNDRVFMVFGSQSHPLAISSNAPAYNNLSAGYTNEGIALQYLDDVAFVNDSYATLGQFTPTAGNFGSNNTIAETRLFPIGSAGQIAATNALRAMFDSVPPVSSSVYYDGVDEIGWGIATMSEPSLGANSLPNDEGLVALAQITLPRNSSLSGTLNFKVQPSSNSNLPTEIATISFDIPEVTEGLDLQFANAGGGIAGCTDETACNFNDAACVDDESCEFESCLGCTDEGACNFNAEATVDDGSCEYTSCEGCTDEEACNYDPEALIDDGSCVFPGCTNGCACNFDPNACADDGSCQYEDVLGNCGGDCSSDLDGDDICDDVDECVGMFDSCGVCNGQGAIYDCGCSDIPEGDCDCNGNQLDAVGDCGGDCLADEDGNGICDDDEVPGCTVEEACNYDANATWNDHSCDFTTCLVFGCMDATACNYNANATVDNGTCAETDSCDVCGGPGEAFQCGCNNIPEGDCDCNGNQLDAVGDCGGDCEADEDGDGFCDADQGCTYPDATNYTSGATVDDGSCEWCPADLDGNGTVQFTDLLDFLGLYGTSCE